MITNLISNVIILLINHLTIFLSKLFDITYCCFLVLVQSCNLLEFYIFDHFGWNWALLVINYKFLKIMGMIILLFWHYILSLLFMQVWLVSWSSTVLKYLIWRRISGLRKTNISPIEQSCIINFIGNSICIMIVLWSISFLYMRSLFVW